MSVGIVLGILNLNAVPITIVNGDFEESTVDRTFVTYGAGSTALPGWTIAGGSIDHIGNYWQAASGSQSLDMSGEGPGTIEQTIVVPIDGTVTVTFSLAGNPDDTRKVKELEVSLISGGGSHIFTFDATGQTRAAMGWVTEQAIFPNIAADTYTLQFKSLNQTAWGPALDNVSASVPDGGLTLFLLGSSILGLATLRRRLC